MNRRLRRNPPKDTLALRSGRSTLPIALPTELNTMTPSLPAPPPQPHQRLPSMSSRRASATHKGKTSGLVEAIYIGPQFLLIHDARIVPGDTVNGIGEPDRIIGLDHDIIGRIEALAVEPIGQHGDGSVIFGARDAAAGVLASDKPALPIASEAVCLIGWLAELLVAPVSSSQRMIGSLATSDHNR